MEISKVVLLQNCSEVVLQTKAFLNQDISVWNWIQKNYFSTEQLYKNKNLSFTSFSDRNSIDVKYCPQSNLLPYFSMPPSPNCTQAAFIHVCHSWLQQWHTSILNPPNWTKTWLLPKWKLYIIHISRYETSHKCLIWVQILMHDQTQLQSDTCEQHHVEQCAMFHLCQQHCHQT